MNVWELSNPFLNSAYNTEEITMKFLKKLKVNNNQNVRLKVNEMNLKWYLEVNP